MAYSIKDCGMHYVVEQDGVKLGEVDTPGEADTLIRNAQQESERDRLQASCKHENYTELMGGTITVCEDCGLEIDYEGEDEPEFVQSITENFGVGITLADEHDDATSDPYDYFMAFNQYYGNRAHCDYRDASCSDDGILWQASDPSAPHFCTSHYFPQEQLGYQFIAAKVAA